MTTSIQERRELQQLIRRDLEKLQLSKLNRVLSEAKDRPFYRERLARVSVPLRSLEQLREIPTLSKHELIAASRGQAGKIFELPREHYTRFHQTSGTSGYPMPVLDTPQDWEWWLECWQYVLDAAEVGSGDIAMMAFSFGPFIGFWTAHDALATRGALVVPGGGMSSEARLAMIRDHRCNLLCCTPTYALHLATVAQQASLDLRSGSVDRIIVAGEPGGSVPAIRSRIEQAWGARVIDHTGSSELGAWGFGSPDGRGIHVIETEFVAEVLKPNSHSDAGESPSDARPPSEMPRAEEGELGELVLTNLGRLGGPAIRYRTGDIVRARRSDQQRSGFLWLDGGVLGRADDMMVIRGVNVFPSSIEAIVREVDGAAEFRMIASRSDEMDQLEIEIESSAERASELAALLRDRLAMRVGVKTVEAESLPRFQAKSRRWIDRRSETE